MRVALVLSAFAHVAGVLFLPRILDLSTPQPIPISYEIEVVSIPPLEPEPEVKSVEAPPEPKPEPPPPPKPKPPPPKPKPKPEPKKAAVKEEKKPEPKPEPPPKPKPKPKPETKPEVKKPAPEKPLPRPEIVAKAPPPASKGVQRQQLPPILNAWGRLVQRKVEKYWQIPGGVLLTEENREVHISFWVDRDGRLLGRPKIVKDASDPALGESGIRSILMAEPLPPLPMEFRGRQQEVVYVFSLMK